MGNQCGCDADLDDILQYDSKVLAPHKMQTAPLSNSDEFEEASPQKGDRSPDKSNKFIKAYEESREKQKEQKFYLRGFGDAHQRQFHRTPQVRHVQRKQEAVEQRPVREPPKTERKARENVREEKQEEEQIIIMDVPQFDDEQPPLKKQASFGATTDFVPLPEKEVEDQGIQCDLQPPPPPPPVQQEVQVRPRPRSPTPPKEEKKEVHQYSMLKTETATPVKNDQSFQSRLKLPPRKQLFQTPTQEYKPSKKAQQFKQEQEEKKKKKLTSQPKITNFELSPQKKQVIIQSSLKEKSVISNYFDFSQGFSLFDEADPILHQGELFRFKPGLEHNFISRWVQISGRAFRYYRNQIQSFGGLHRPIVSIPKNSIETIKILKIDAEQFFAKSEMNERQKMELKLFKNLFEIELKEHYENVYKFRDEEIELVNDIKMFTRRRPQTPPNEKRSDMLMSACGVSYKTIPVPSEKRRERKRMRSRARSDYDIRMDQFKQEKYQSTTCNHLHRNSFLQFSNSPTKRNRVVRGHLMAIRDLDEGGAKNGYVEDQEILEREFGIQSPSKNIFHYKIWSIRQGDWYNSERRLIFAARNRKEMKRWVSYFRQEATKNKQFKKKLPEDDIFGKDLQAEYRPEDDILNIKLAGSGSPKKIKKQETKRMMGRRPGSQLEDSFEKTPHDGGLLLKMHKGTRSFEVGEEDRGAEQEEMLGMNEEFDLSFQGAAKTRNGAQKIFTDQDA